MSTKKQKQKRAPIAAPAASPALPRPPPKLYFINAPVDYAMVGGVSILACLVLWWWMSRERSPEADALAASLVWVINWPHFSATSYRLYQSRENIRQYPMTALAVPFVAIAGVLASLLSPALIAPYFIKLFLIWSPYHFSGQTVGVTMVYCRRAGWNIEPWQRRALSAFVFGSFLYPTLRGELAPGGSEFYGIHYPGLGLPAWTATGAGIFMWCGGAVFLAFVIKQCLQRKRFVPPILLLPAMTQYFWFVGGSGVMAFTVFVPAFHSVQYMLIAWSMQLKEKMDRQRIAPSSGYVLSESVRWGLINFGGGAALFFGIPHLLSELTHAPLPLVTGVVISGVQIHHFFVDGVIWKLKSKNVSSPLMVNVTEMLRAPPAPLSAQERAA